jgi:hypothetical protein
MLQPQKRFPAKLLPLIALIGLICTDQLQDACISTGAGPVYFL